MAKDRRRPLHCVTLACSSDPDMSALINAGHLVFLELTRPWIDVQLASRAR